MASVDITVRMMDENVLQTSKQIQAGMDAFNKKLKDSGVSLQAYNQAIKNQEEAAKKLIEVEQNAAKKRQAAWDQAAKNAKQGGAEIVAMLYAIKKGYDETVGVTMEYARAVRDLSIAQGQGAEEASKTLQVLDDFEIGAEDVTAAMRAMKEKGLVPTVSTLADLADKFVATTDPAERLKLAQDNLGRSSAKFLNLLSQGGDVLRENATQINKNLILTDKQVKQTEEYRLALDNLNDSIMGMKVAAGKDLIPDLTKGIWQLMNAKKIAEEMIRLRKDGAGGTFVSPKELTAIQLQAEANVKASDTMGDYYRSTALASEGTDKFGNSLAAATERQIEFGRAGDDVYKGTKDIIGSLDKFVSTVESVSSAQRSFNQGMAEANDQLKHHKITTKEYNKTVAELRATYDEAAKGIVADLIMMKLTADGTFDTSDMNAYMAALERLGLATEHDVEVTRAMYEAANNAALGWGNANESIAHTGKLADDVYKPLKTMSDNLYHTGKRAEDAAGGMDDFKDEQSKLAKGINSESAPAVHNLKNAISGLSGKSVTVDVYIKTHGGSAGLMSYMQAPILPHPGQQQVAQNKWTGGQIGNGWSVVGDLPGGGWGPYTEVVSPTGYVYNAEESRRLKQMGLLGDNTQSLYVGSDNVGISHPIVRPSTHKRSTGGGGHSPFVGGSSVSSSGTVSGSSMTGAPDVVASSFAAPAQVAAQQQQAVVSNTQQQTAAQGQTNSLLAAILAKLPSAQQNAKANREAQSRVS